MRRFVVQGTFFLHTDAGVNFFVETTPDKSFVVTATAMLPKIQQEFSQNNYNGILTSLMDEAMGVAVFFAGYSAVVSNINVTYHHPIPAEKNITVHAYISTIEGRNLSVQSKILLDDDTLVVDGHGLFITLTEDHINWGYSFTEIR